MRAPLVPPSRAARTSGVHPPLKRGHALARAPPQQRTSRWLKCSRVHAYASSPHGSPGLAGRPFIAGMGRCGARTPLGAMAMVAPSLGMCTFRRWPARCWRVVCARVCVLGVMVAAAARARAADARDAAWPVCLPPQPQDDKVPQEAVPPAQH
jgi:hypothetical protein